jgi:hypothetical protein
MDYVFVFQSNNVTCSICILWHVDPLLGNNLEIDD